MRPQQIGATKYGPTSRPRYSPRKPCFVVITHRYELDSPEAQPPLYKIAAKTIYRDDTLSLSRTVRLEDVDIAKKWWIQLLKEYHKVSSFWHDITPLGPALLRPESKTKTKTDRKSHRLTNPKINQPKSTQPKSTQPKSTHRRRHRHDVDLTTRHNLDLTMSRQIQKQLLAATDAATKATKAATSVIAAANAAAQRVSAAVDALKLQQSQSQQQTPVRRKRSRKHQHRSPHSDSTYTDSQTPTPPRAIEATPHHAHHHAKEEGVIAVATTHTHVTTHPHIT